MTARGESAYRTFRAMDTSRTCAPSSDLASASGASWAAAARECRTNGLQHAGDLVHEDLPYFRGASQMPSRVGTAAMSAGIAFDARPRNSWPFAGAFGKARRLDKLRHGASACDRALLRGGEEVGSIKASRVVVLVRSTGKRLGNPFGAVASARRSRRARRRACAERARAVDCPRRQCGASRVRVDASSQRARAPRDPVALTSTEENDDTVP